MSRKPTVQEVIEAACNATGARRADLTRRDAFGRLTTAGKLCIARRIVVRVLRDARGMSLAEASRTLGYRSGSGPGDMRISRRFARFEERAERETRDAIARLTAAPAPAQAQQAA